MKLQERCHVFFLGDLNYRAVPHDLTHARDSTLKRVAYASSKPSKTAWAAATRDDELIRDRRSGRALCGFREAPIYFAPTFRRVPGVALPGREAGAAEAHAAGAGGVGRGPEVSVLDGSRARGVAARRRGARAPSVRHARVPVA